jgi:hypothetical protein
MDLRSVRPGTTVMWSVLLATNTGLKRTVPNATNSSVREDTLFVEISPIARLLDQRGRKAMGVSPVMRQLMMHKVVDLRIDECPS